MDIGDFMEQLNRSELRKKIMTILYQINIYEKNKMIFDVDQVIHEVLEIDNEFVKEDVYGVLTYRNDIDELAKIIILIGKGQVLYDGSLQKLKNNYANKKYITVNTKDAINIRTKGVLKKEKTKDGYLFTIDSKELNISDFLNVISKKVQIEDVEIDINPADIKM